jgi:nucleotide-binding universal stress UspA family protein
MSRILVAYDGSPSARRALARAATILRDGDELAVLAVAAPTLASIGPNPTILPADLDERNRELAEAQAWLEDRGIQATTLAGIGEAGPAICGTAEREGYDTIVVGRRNVTGIRRLLLGSVSSRVVNGATCDVIVAR